MTRHELISLGGVYGLILQYRHISFFTPLLLALAGLTGCASISSTEQQSTAESVTNATTSTKPQPRPHRGLAIAHDMVGMPYRYGGADPGGFDCSGLVYYSYRKAGIKVPRTAAEQYRKSKRVQAGPLQPGDLVFFTISRGKPSHVGIYAGNGRFIHAPSIGKSVVYASLHDPYWGVRLAGSGRLQ